MNTMWLRIRAPFAAFRGFQAGVYRSTSPVMPPSAAYGLILNLAGIEMRGPMSNVTTEIREGLPKLRLAIGVISIPERSTLYQQLHSYPVGASGKELKEKTKGAKFWITPVKREILIDYDGIIGIQADDPDLFNRIRSGLRGEYSEARYGLPFAGDNNLLIDRIELLDEPTSSTQWYSQLSINDSPRKGSCRLTVGINRTNNSLTTTLLFAPEISDMNLPSEQAWTWTPSDPA